MSNRHLWLYLAVALLILGCVVIAPVWRALHG